MNVQLRPMCLLGFGLLILLAASAASAAEGTTEQLYNRWVSTTGDTWEPGDTGEKDPLFVELLRREDADLFFLRKLPGLNYRVRALSQIGLARLKTDRSFAILEKESRDALFREERLRALETLAEFRQSRCVPILLEALSNYTPGDDLYKVGQLLAASSDEQINVGLVKILKDPAKNAIYGERALRVFDDARGAEMARHCVAAVAAYILGERNVGDAIDATYQLAIDPTNENSLAIALDGLRRHRKKNVVPMFLDLMERWQKPEYTEWREGDLPIIMWLPEKLARQTSDVLGPAPKTTRQWSDWWTKAEPLFTDDLRRKDLPAGAEWKDPQQVGSDPKQLVFRVALDANSYYTSNSTTRQAIKRAGSYRLFLRESAAP